MENPETVVYVSIRGDLIEYQIRNPSSDTDLKSAVQIIAEHSRVLGIPFNCSIALFGSSKNGESKK